MNLIIMGESRSGKTMLANMIGSTIKGYSVISLDALIIAFKECLPITQIDFSKGAGNKKDFPNFLETFFDVSVSKANKNNMYYCIEGGPLTEEYILKFNKKLNTKVIFLGKTQITPQEFFNTIRHYENIYDYGGWTKRLDDNTLLSWCKNWIERSKKYKKFCKQNNIEYYDTSYNQVEILQKITQKISKNYKK